MFVLPGIISVTPTRTIKKNLLAKEKIKKWLPVDLYVGGAEHTVLHLLYSRFFTKVLHNLGLIDFDEPFLKLRHQGIILAEDGRKMSKSLGNVINPDDIVAQYGADALRMFEMFMGPLEDAKKWDTKGIIGVYRFLERARSIVYNVKEKGEKKSYKDFIKQANRTIKWVEEDLVKMKLNTAISFLMVYVNYLNTFYYLDMKDNNGKKVGLDVIEILVKLIAPFAPHIAEELWQQLGHKKSVFTEKWPEHDPALVKDETIELVIQINGKLRDKISVPADISEEAAKKTALESEKIKQWLEGKEPRKVIFVKGRLINIVV